MCFTSIIVFVTCKYTGVAASVFIFIDTCWYLTIGCWYFYASKVSLHLNNFVSLIPTGNRKRILHKNEREHFNKLNV